jgi:protein TonB
MTKQKINIRKNRLSSSRIQKHKDFNSLYGQYQQEKQTSIHRKRLRSIVLGTSFLVILLVYGIFLVEKNKEFEFDSLSEHKTQKTQRKSDEGLVDLLELPDNQEVKSQKLEPESEIPATEPEFKNRIASYSDSSDVVAVFYIEKPAQPVEGFDAFYQNYIKKNLIYPEEAKERRLRGKVYLQFVVEKDGSIANIEVMSGLIPACNQEAIRVMQNSPKWKAATFKHGTARQTIAMPITFGEE